MEPKLQYQVRAIGYNNYFYFELMQYCVCELALSLMNFDVFGKIV
jgi:hypothetical protein